MNTFELAIAILIAITLIVAIGISVLHHRQLHRRSRALHQLLDDADRLESDLKECRQRLDRAHAVLAAGPAPVAGEVDARQAVDSGLRSLLEHRLWIRDHAARASQEELDNAVSALADARARLEPQLRELDQAQRELEQAVRERIERES